MRQSAPGGAANAGWYHEKPRPCQAIFGLAETGLLQFAPNSRRYDMRDAIVKAVARHAAKVAKQKRSVPKSIQCRTDSRGAIIWPPDLSDFGHHGTRDPDPDSCTFPPDTFMFPWRG
ncbi:MAG: hypothetical protein A3A44_03720 [Candidatus Sungbacteria bacterium RIFCSPLOWO2_01_FULL_60_25]|uniref:Uncharacterized protein n=1 Tax=Candidatus Sungbacteria bacterium RIFCSPLOWO2_01_FULL_60_25 TaxID=1802281 RepID=A0A1G2LGI8_9BACT|nr:MAG: hypothetical protein A3A44_03720 [Candidatus Sungbacteria bacterium RIFCSPLOWO2_01_FULL_60_25]